MNHLHRKLSALLLAVLLAGSPASYALAEVSPAGQAATPEAAATPEDAPTAPIAGPVPTASPEQAATPVPT